MHAAHLGCPYNCQSIKHGTKEKRLHNLCRSSSPGEAEYQSHL